MNKGKLILIIFIIISLLALAGLYQYKSSHKPEFIGQQIKIGLVGPWTGFSAENGLSMKKGVELAVMNINKTGGVNGHEIILIDYDDKGSPSECVKAVKQLAEIHNVAAIIGPFNSSCALAVIDIINNLQIPLITPVAMADAINLKDDYIFRNTLGVTQANEKTNDFVFFKNKQYIMLDGFGAKTLGVLWQNDIWGSQMQETVLSDLKKIGRTDALIFDEPFELGQSDFSKLFKKYNSNFPDVIYVVALDKEAIKIVRQGREAGFKGLFYGEGGFNVQNFDSDLGELAQGCLFSTQWHPSFSTPMSDLFIKLYTDNYNDTPDMFSAISYEATYILERSLSRTIAYQGKEDYRQYLRKELSQTKNFSGITGDISFDSVGQSDRPVFIMQKRWSGQDIESVIIYPTKYAQSNLVLNFDFEKLFKKDK